MNKQKVLDNLMDIREWAGTVDHPTTESEKDEYMHTIVQVASETIKEVNSKINMPKVFDEWAKPYDTYTIKGLDDALKNLFDIYETQVCENKAEQALSDWLDGGYSIGKYVKCEKALIAGYEVLPCPY